MLRMSSAYTLLKATGQGPKKEETPGGKGKISRRKVKRWCTLSRLRLVMVPVFFNIYLLFPLGHCVCPRHVTRL